jgi:SAM-dependent methyltransferase
VTFIRESFSNVDVIRDFYWYSGQEKDRAEEPVLDQTLAPFQPTPGGRLLDIGCWDGSKTIRVRERVRADKAYGVDFVADALAQAQRLGIHTSCVDLNAELPLAFPTDFFDIVFCGDVIEHVFSPDDLLDEIARLLRPGGYAVLTTPNLASWRNRLVLLLGWQPFSSEVSTRNHYGNPLAPQGLPSGHIRLFTLHALCEMARASGLCVEQVRGLRSSNQASAVTSRVARWLDGLIVPLWPALADGIVVRLRKPLEQPNGCSLSARFSPRGTPK